MTRTLSSSYGVSAIYMLPELFDKELHHEVPWNKGRSEGGFRLGVKRGIRASERPSKWMLRRAERQAKGL
jgi:hypothetical protein